MQGKYTIPVIHDAVTAILKMSRLKSQLETQENNIELYKETLSILQERFKEQQITASQLNRQEYELQKLLSVYQNTKANEWIYKLSYLNATGQLSRLWK